MQSVSCYLCDANDYSVLFRGSEPTASLSIDHLAARKGSINKAYSHRWVRCNQCGLVYANPVPDKDELAALYSLSDQSSYAEEEDNICFTYGQYLDVYRAYIVDRRSAVDIGAGSGFFVRVLMRYGFEQVTGIEPSRAACDSAPADVRPHLLNTVCDHMDFQPGSLDFISCLQTLEHVHDPHKLVGEISRLLAGNGIVFCVAHDVRSLGARMLGSRHPIVNAGHLTLFDKTTLRRMFSKHLDVIEVFDIKNRYSLNYWISLLPLPPLVRGGIVRLCAKAGIGSIPLSMKLGNIGLIARQRR